MKKIIFLLVFILTVSSGFSQKRKRVHQANHMTSEQRTILTVKKLTLALDLDRNQAKKVAVLFTKMAKKRKAKGQKVKKEMMVKREKMMKERKEGKLKKEHKGKMRVKRRGQNFDAQNKALDHMIALQSEMKKILTKEQYARFKKMKKRRIKSAKHKVKKHKIAKRMKKGHR